MNVPFLGEIPIDPLIREGGDRGQPVAALDAPSSQKTLFEKLAKTIVEQAETSKAKHRPTISIAD